MFHYKLEGCRSVKRDFEEKSVNKGTHVHVNTDMLTLRPFSRDDFDAFEFGLENQAEPVDEFDSIAELDSLFKQEKPIAGRKTAFKEILELQKSATIYTNPGLQLQIFDKQDGEWKGYVAIYNARWNLLSANMDYYLLNQFWGQGIAAEAVKGALSLCWNELDMHRMEASVEERNHRSRRFTEKLGFVYEGTRRHGAQINGEWKNLRIYSALVIDETLGA